MELTELSLFPKYLVEDKSSNSSSSESERYTTSKKRKFSSNSDHQNLHLLEAKDPLPLDWEQCLELHSGKMYYLNRKASSKTWNWPRDLKLDLELKISSSKISSDQTLFKEDLNNNNINYTKSSDSNMVALACFNCHLLVILSKSCPSCPNCKFVHSLPPSSHSDVISHPSRPSLGTLSLWN